MLELCIKAYMKLRTYILDVIRSRNIPDDKWKQTIIIRKIMRIFLFVLPLLLYCLISFILWFKFDMTKIIEIIYIVITIVLFALLLFIIIKFRIKIKDYIIDYYVERFKNIGLTNEQGNAPTYKNMKYDTAVTGREIYYFYDVDVDYSKFSEPVVIRGLRNIFRGYVSPDVGNTYGIMQFSVLPSCKSSCRNLTINDLWLVENIIHLGIYGNTGSGKSVRHCILP